MTEELFKERQRDESRGSLISKIEYLLDVYDTLTPAGKTSC